MSKKNELSIAAIKDVDEIMKYIDLEWKRDHILAVNKDFFNLDTLDSSSPNNNLASNSISSLSRPIEEWSANM